MRPETLQLLRALYDDLSRPDPYPDGASDAEQDAWAERGWADSWLAGLLSRATNSGRVTRDEIAEGRSLSAQHGSRVGRARAAEAYDLLAREAG